jgi:foldase protein PrsA
MRAKVTNRPASPDDMSAIKSAFQLAILLAAAALLVCHLAGCGDGGGSTEAIVKVNGETITRGQYLEALRRQHGPLALKTLVDQAIVDGLAAEKGIQPDEARVEWKMESARTQAGGAQALEEKLTAKGQTIDDLRRSLGKEALAEQLMAAQVDVSDKEIEKYYEANKDQFKHGKMIKGRLMLFESRKNAEEIHRILHLPDADFAGLAEALSIDPGTKDEGGDMGWIERGDYASEITDPAFKLEPGDYTDILECPDGWAIVLVEDEKPPGHKPLEEVRDTVEAMIRNDKESQLRPQWAAEQRKKAHIKVFDRDLAERFALIRDR